MTRLDVMNTLGIDGIRKVSDSTTVVESHGCAWPATPLEIRMWHLLQKLTTP